MKLTVLGAGCWGLTLTWLLTDNFEKVCVWKVKCFTIFWEEPCLLVKQGNLIYSGMKKSSMKNFLVGLTYA